MKRKSILVDENVHARFSVLWKKTPSYLNGYGDSSSDVLRFLIDFYEKHRSSEMEQALILIDTIKKGVVEMEKKWVTMHKHKGYEIQKFLPAEMGDPMDYRIQPALSGWDGGTYNLPCAFKTVDEAVEAINKYGVEV